MMTRAEHIAKAQDFIQRAGDDFANPMFGKWLSLANAHSRVAAAMGPDAPMVSTGTLEEYTDELGISWTGRELPKNLRDTECLTRGGSLNCIREDEEHLCPQKPHV